MWPLDGRSASGGWERIAGSAHAACHHHGPLPLGLDIQLIAQTFIYYSIVIFGLLVAVPVGITTKKFGGWCILYGDVTDDKLTFGASVYCHYVTYVNVLISVVYGGVLAVSHTVAVVRNVQGAAQQLSGVRSPIWSIVLLGCNTIVTLLSLGSACILTVGFQRWCSSLLSNARLHHGYHLQTCSEAEHLEWENVDGSSFYACYSIATASAWLSLFAWLIQTSLNLLVFIRLKKDEFGLSVLDSADNSPVHEPVLPRSSSPERY